MPLARWTLGPVNQTGRDILLLSLKRFRSLFPEFTRMVCFNHISIDDIRQFSPYAELREQEEHEAGIPLSAPKFNFDEAVGCGWKLCPPRLAKDDHELWIDNDIIIYRRLGDIERWLSLRDHALISEGLHRMRMYGGFDAVVPPGVFLCAGFFGLPPQFDFGNAIRTTYDLVGGRFIGGFDEQGLTASIVTSLPYVLVPNTTMHISEDHVEFPNHIPDAIHFVQANRKEWHRGWQAFLRMRQDFLI